MRAFWVCCREITPLAITLYRGIMVSFTCVTSLRLLENANRTLWHRQYEKIFNMSSHIWAFVLWISESHADVMWRLFASYQPRDSCGSFISASQSMISGANGLELRLRFSRRWYLLAKDRDMVVGIKITHVVTSCSLVWTAREWSQFCYRQTSNIFFTSRWHLRGLLLSWSHIMLSSLGTK